MNLIETPSLNPRQKELLCKLWNQEYPEKLAYNTSADFENYLNSLMDSCHFILYDDEGNLQGWAFTFLREGEKWFGLIIDSSMHGQGKGTLLLNRLKEKEKALNGWVIDHGKDLKKNGEPYKSPVNFYTKNGFSICNDQRLDTPKISAVKIKWSR